MQFVLYYHNNTLPVCTGPRRYHPFHIVCEHNQWYLDILVDLKITSHYYPRHQQVVQYFCVCVCKKLRGVPSSKHIIMGVNLPVPWTLKGTDIWEDKWTQSNELPCCSAKIKLCRWTHFYAKLFYKFIKRNKVFVSVTFVCLSRSHFDRTQLKIEYFMEFRWNPFKTVYMFKLNGFVLTHEWDNIKV